MQLHPYSDIEKQYTVEFCHGLSMFGALSDDCLDFLLRRGAIYYAETGDCLFKLGDDSEVFYIIISGSAHYYRPNDIGDMVALRVYQPGEQVGFVGMIGLQKRRGDAFMEEPGYLLEVSVEIFHQFCELYPQAFQILLINITREMSREISHLNLMYANTQEKNNL